MKSKVLTAILMAITISFIVSQVIALGWLGRIMNARNIIAKAEAMQTIEEMSQTEAVREAIELQAFIDNL